MARPNNQQPPPPPGPPDGPPGGPPGPPTSPPMGPPAAPAGRHPGALPLPPPPPPAPPGDDGGAGDDEGPSWWIVGVVVLALVVAPLVGLFAWLGGDDPAPAPTAAASSGEDETGGPSPSPSLTPDLPAPTPDAPGDDLPFGDLLGSDVLAQCLVPQGMTPRLEGTPLPDDPTEAITTIADQVAEIRGLEFSSPVDLDLLSDEELADRVVAVSEEDYLVEDAALDDAIMTTLRQLPPDQDLRDIYFDLLGEQVAGFYDPETGELVAEASGDLAPQDLVIVAHELDHALTDQALGLPDFEGMEGDVDGLLAQQGLVEGDASVLMQQWALGNLSLLDIAQLGAAPIDTPLLDAAPWVLQAQLLYPYTAGLEFVCQLYVEGGWAAVDAAYTDLPTTSAQVLFPQRYLVGEGAVDVAAVTTSDPGWEEARATTYGAAELQWLIEAPANDRELGPPNARQRVADWAGGRQTVWQRDGDTMVAIDLVQQPGGDLCTTLGEWVEATWPERTVAANDDATTTWEGDDGAVSLTCDGDAVRAVVGPTVAAVTSVG